MYFNTWLTFISLTDGVCHLQLSVLANGERIAYGVLPFAGFGCPVPDVTNIYLI